MVTLDDITYLPMIRSRLAELKGYSNLRPETQAALKPIISLGRCFKRTTPASVAEHLNETLDHYFLDVNFEKTESCEGSRALGNPAGGFKNWRDFVAAAAPNATPIALLGDAGFGSLRNFGRQVRMIERDHGAVVVRSLRPSADADALEAAVLSVDEIENLLIVLDFGSVRESLGQRQVEAIDLISRLRTIDDTVRVGVLSSSFPRSVTRFGGDSAGTLEMFERLIHRNIGGDSVAIYGDYAGVSADPTDPSIRANWVPRIDFPTDLEWHYRRFRDPDGGLQECAKQIVALEEWDAESDFIKSVWGAAKITETAEAGPVKGFLSAGSWIAVRVNLHIERQFERAKSELSGGSDWDDFDWGDDV